MSRTSATREAWYPQTREEREAVLRELREVLASPHFCNSKRYPALLQYIVENTLAGKSDLLKERTLGIEVFDRPPTYDTNADTVVRYTAGEVRKRLSLYYHEIGRKAAIQISLPAGSYVPEFLYAQHAPGDLAAALATRLDDAHDLVNAAQGPNSTALPTALPAAPDMGLHATADGMAHPVAIPGATPVATPGATLRHHRAAARRRWLIFGAMLAALAVAVGWRYRAVPPRTALDDFWGPVLREQHMVPICTGGSVFAQNNYSGVLTAGKDINYPFVSIQAASSIAQLGALLERSGATTQLESSASTPLTALREHSVILLGAYNNQWTLRLVEPLRFHFAPYPPGSIVDRMHSRTVWSRDESVPYSSAGDYALIARFRDPTTDSWIVVLAGLGRNGSEAATDFVASPHYLQLLRDRLGSNFANRNVEAVLKVSVIDGKTGAPSILDAHVW